ncbi:MAG: aminoacyl-tRNA hydrolase [Alphaproteobacteria bacterium CG11_big_fil_rev_8_21_14_0_20_44_7]|nr:MAG: aminoacyl-tRNA hydrolase [Alphaproteobacteria bacterium CG11_big_fil_rev_8_21_14_0_20_44_7]
MYLIVGLGNPGAKYESHRHNLGFMAIDAIAEKLGSPSFSEKFDGQFAALGTEQDKLFLLKPMNFMNNSGISISKLANFYKIPLENIIVIYDELDLELCKIKIKQGGGSGGHNGIKSIDSHLGKDYFRLRFGIDHPGDKDFVTPYVLSNFTNNEQARVNKSLKIIAENIEMLLKQERELFLTKYYQELGETEL